MALLPAAGAFGPSGRVLLFAVIAPVVGIRLKTFGQRRFRGHRRLFAQLSLGLFPVDLIATFGSPFALPDTVSESLNARKQLWRRHGISGRGVLEMRAQYEPAGIATIGAAHYPL